MKAYTIHVTGIVQGIGFRPFVSKLAHELRLVGTVRNDTSGVEIHIQGVDADCQLFVERLQSELPMHGRIDTLRVEPSTVQSLHSFTIILSQGAKGNAFIGADMAPCEACLQDIQDPENRRFHYGFTNCTNCGPRYTIIESTPYDRHKTSMKAFPMCEECQGEYEDLEGRRYHAEPNACEQCGPMFTLQGTDGMVLATGQDAIEQAKEYIQQGAIVALKGVGGYHLVCDALQENAVQTLRQRKGRPRKPLAVMAGSLETAKQYVYISEKEEELLLSPARPIVLLRKVTEHNTVAPSVAPGMETLGILLPYAPYHYSLVPFNALWVMTSANRSGDPVLYNDAQALEELQGIADYILTHNREIISPVDDSVVQVVHDTSIMIRRSRGYVPVSIPVVALEKRSTMLAMGADMKAAFAMNRGSHAILSPYMGDMEHQRVQDLLWSTTKRYEDLFQLQPTEVIVDAHPNYYTSQCGRIYAEKYQLPVIEVQHHHAHVASVLAEYNIQEPVLGICFDGTGYGTDGTLWGGEFLYCHQEHMERMAHLSYAPLPGGEVAVREPWRQALWYVNQTYPSGGPTVIEEWKKTLPKGWELLEKMMPHMQMIRSSSGGRLFDTVASLLGVGHEHLYDAQLAIELEQLALSERGTILDMKLDGTVLDTMSLVRSVIEQLECGESVAKISANFHRTLIYYIGQMAKQCCKERQISHIVLCGGVFQNRILLEGVIRELEEYHIHIPNQSPLNDGGIALGQLWLGNYMNR
ncbi:MAG: carbamoyltransferase HypF [Veillonella sp. oral taxon 780]|uniref:carbamoyltransferase HypF n=1 Tax=Veillonella sp. oral taxon 780 TaxID=671229 RepID=UPI00021A2A38|nr:carbamoyltransferase HypF [Veillonella sp. oral taxon 780]EGS35540.1 carbamoyltransferase HypF [Veillonella sp. oral taxon 780 str. F0422]MBS6626203.1 carbamoyltransferase HypF [Veillonella sp. oral taxon 780]